MKKLNMTFSALLIMCAFMYSNAQDIIHDAEYYILKAQHGDEWQKQDKEIQKN